MTLLSDRTPPVPPWRDPTDPGPLLMILRHPLLLVGIIAFCLTGALAYLRVATPLYTSTASLRVESGAPRVIGAGDAPRGSDEMSAFLNAELAVLTSTPVLETALATPALKGIKSLASDPDPVGALKKGLRVAVGRKDEIISVEFDAPSPADAAAIVNAVVDAYVAHESMQQEATDGKLLAILSRERTETSDAAAARNEEMLHILRQAGSATLDAHEKTQELASIKSTLRAAQLDAAAAESQYREAAASLGKDAALHKQLDEMTSAGNVPTNSDVENSEVRLEITSLELKKQDLIGARTYLPSNPNLISVQQQLDRLRVLYAASLHGRLMQAKERASQLEMAVKEQEAAAQDIAAKSARYSQADLQLKRLDHHLDILDERINELTARQNSGALRVTMIERARPVLRATRPDRARILALAGILGAALGAVAAYARENSRLHFIELTRLQAPELESNPAPALEPAPKVPVGARVALNRQAISGRSRPGAGDTRIVRIGER